MNRNFGTVVRAFVPIVCSALLVTAGWAQQRPMALDRERVEFVMGNVQFALLHELAHLAIYEADLPILGPEEQAADYIATMSLVRPLAEPPVGGERWLDFALTAADAFVILWQLGQQTGAEFPYWDSHTLSIQRFFTIGCLLYGSDTERFSRIPEVFGMPMERAGRCEAEFRRAARSIDWYLENFGRHAGDPKTATAKIRIEAPRTQISARLLDELRKLELLEWTLVRLEDLVALRDDATVVLRACSVPEAAWLPEQRELVICYELLDLYFVLSGDRKRHTISSLAEG